VRRYALGLGLKIGAHALRATAATNALDHDADIAKVQEWLGHANVAVINPRLVLRIRCEEPFPSVRPARGLLRSDGGIP
jgi:integrase